jgi:uroporphyrinogen decarboxylase
VANLKSKPLLDVLKGRTPERRPIWFMRQAGRYLPEYRSVRERAGSFLKLCFDPELAAEVTLQPLRRYDFDAAIIFSDILIVPHAMGLPLSFVEGEGPLLQPVRSASDVGALKPKPDDRILGSISQALSYVKPQLPAGAALIGFSGAPWTVSTYMVEGRTSDRRGVLEIARQKPLWFSELIVRITDITIEYLSRQVAAGAEVLQIFDSWAGGLEGSMLDDYSIEPMANIISALKRRHPEIPIIAFARGAGLHHARVAAKTGADAISVEQDISLQDLLENIPSYVTIQGNLAPEALLGTEDALSKAVAATLDGVPINRHIFNLGHGIHQTTRPNMVTAAIDAVRMHDRV